MLCARWHCQLLHFTRGGHDTDTRKAAYGNLLKALASISVAAEGCPCLPDTVGLTLNKEKFTQHKTDRFKVNDFMALSTFTALYNHHL